MKPMIAIIALELRRALRDGGIAQGLIFVALVVTVFALGVGPDLDALARVAAPVLWASALFACIISLDRIFRADFEDGTLDILAARFDLFAPVIIAKAFAHWLTTALPLVVSTPLFAIFLGLSPGDAGPLVASLLVGTPALSLIGTIAAAVTLALRRAVILTTILTMPLYMPVLIFGVDAASSGDDMRARASLLLLSAMSLFLIAIAAVAGTFAIRANLD